MKKILLCFLLSFVCIISNAQINDNYTKCEYELFKIESQFNDLKQDINISTLEIKMSGYHNSYFELYNAYLGDFESTKELYNTVKEYINLIIKKSNFTNTQLTLIKRHFDYIEQGINTVEKSLERFKLYLE